VKPGRHAAALALLFACGARTPLDAPSEGPGGVMGPVADASVRDASSDARRALDAGTCRGDAECDDGIACTRDGCDPASRTCAHRPDDALCTPPQLCGAALGCADFAYANTPSALFEVALPAGTLRRISALGTLFDIALHPNGVLYGTIDNVLYTVDRASGALVQVKTLLDAGFNALDAAPDGTLYGGALDEVRTIDPATGATTVAARLPAGEVSSGDLAFVEGNLFITTKGGGAAFDRLVAVDVGSQSARVVGPVGFACVFGLAEFGATLYGFTCEGRVLKIDTRTGAAIELARTSETFYGASAR
jgi:hypothetical protein